MTAILIYIIHFPRFFSRNIFNPPKLLNTKLDDVTISNKLTSVLRTFPLFKPKYNEQIWIVYELTLLRMARLQMST